MERKVLQAGNLFFYEDDLKTPLIQEGNEYKNAIFVKDVELKKLLTDEEMQLVRVARDVNRLTKEIEQKEKEANKTIDQDHLINIKSEIAELKVKLEENQQKYSDLLMKLLSLMPQQTNSTAPQQPITTSNIPQQSVITPVPEIPKQPFSVSKGAVSSIAKQYGIPDDLANMYFMLIDQQLYIKHPGLLYIASKIGYQRIEVESHYNRETETWEATAKIYPKIPSKILNTLNSIPEPQRDVVLKYYLSPTVANGTANKENVKNTRMHAFLKEMAETRAINRALRLYTGYGGTSFEELPDSEIEND